MSAVGLQADTLWNNGTPIANYVSNSVKCDANCGGSGNGPAYTIFDNFTVGPAGWAVSTINLYDFFVSTPTTDYVSTKWSIWSGDPLSTGTVVTGGTTTGSLGAPTCDANGNCLVKISLNVPVTLATGTYYLGTSNTLTGTFATNNQITTDRTFVTPPGTTVSSATAPITGFEQSNGSSSLAAGATWTAGSVNTTLTGSDTAFDIQGTVTPEPGTLALMGLALAGLWFGRRRLA